nr:catalase [Clostridia bacterium]
MHVLKHFLTVCRHRRQVRKLCFKCGLFRQGLTHDLSKFSAAEFWAGAKYFQGNRSPQAREREVLGYSAAWLHHKGRNKHHFEYWTDFADGKRVFVKMPARYLAEMICDRVAACKIYLKKNYTDSSPLEYFEAKTDKEGMNRET